MLKILLVVIQIFCTVYGAYSVCIILFGALKKCPGNASHPAKTRFAAIIAARNEESVIEQSVQTLINQNYPRELFDVYVVPNNCTDDTAGEALRAGAKVLECDVAVKCKGDVLSFAFSRLMQEDKYDAFLVFDADNLVDPGFLQAANDAHQDGVRIAQGYRDIKNPTESWVAGCMSVFFWFMSRLFNRGRRALGLSTMLNGTGIMISADLVRENGWHTSSLTEDLEYTAQCGILGEKIGWMENAIIYDEQPNRFSDSFEQRRRWYAGTLQVFWQCAFKLWRNGFCKPSVQALDFALFFTGALSQFLGLVPAVYTSVQAAQMVSARAGWGAVIGIALGVLTVFLALCSLGAYVMCRLAGKPTKPMRRAIWMFGPFMISWLPANLLGLFLRRGWKPIRHTSQATLSDVAGKG